MELVNFLIMNFVKTREKKNDMIIHHQDHPDTNILINYR